VHVYHQDIVMRREQYQDLLREAERERLIRAARSGPAAGARLYCRAAYWIGTQLVRWGRSLLQSEGVSARSEQPVPRGT
jgi:hypothetical protein